MRKISWTKAIEGDPFLGSIKDSSSAEYIYDHIIWSDEMRIKMLEETNAGHSALSAVAKEIENYCDTTPNCDLDLTNDQAKQCIGRLIALAMLPFGYQPKKEKSKSWLSKNLNLKYFVTAKIYEYVGGETQKVVKTIVDI